MHAISDGSNTAVSHWSSSKEITYDNELRYVISNNVVF